MFMTNQFYRKALVCATMTCAATLLLAQTSAPQKQKVRTGPRAVSVLEMDTKGHTRLVPVTILFQDRYYDASQYQSNPVPMALEPGNVYDVLQSNMPIGLFTTGQPKQLRGMWFALGIWKEKGAEPEHPPAKSEVTVSDNNGGPVLKRHKGSDSSPSSGSDSKTTSKPTDSGPDDPDRPTLKRPQTTQEPASSPTPSDSSTPTVAKRSAQPVDQDLTRDTNETDPDRPVLRKTKAGVNPTNVDVKMTPLVGPPQVAAPAKVAAQSGAEQWKQYISISDAEKTEYRPFAYDLKPEEKAQLADKMQKIAALDLQKWALAHGGVKLIPKLTFTDFDLRAFDVDYSNNPEAVFTASYSPVSTAHTKPVTYYVTLVARQDATGDLTPIFAQITDSTRLDAYARLELVDAVDADGYGRGSLLFREFTDSGKAFVLYRVDPYNVVKLFEGASGE